MPDLVVENWTAVMAPAKNPEAVVERHSREFLELMNTLDIVEKVQTQTQAYTEAGAPGCASG